MSEEGNTSIPPVVGGETSTESASAVADDSHEGKEEQPGPSSGERGTAIIVPFRDLHPEQNRASHLQAFIQRVPSIFEGQDIHIFIIEQSNDGRKFNRGKLLNIGYDLAAKQGWEVFVFHDVDLIPSPDLVPYYLHHPKNNPVHIARVWNRYSGNPKYIGGAVAFSKEDFKRINGFPNNFWGWGGEDDEMRHRINEVGLTVSSPTEGSLEDLECQTLDEKLNTLRANKEWKCNVKWEVLKEHKSTWQQNGLADLNYELLQETVLNDHATKFTVDVKLNNGHWTDTTFQIESSGGGGGGRRDRDRGGYRDRDDRKRPRYDEDDRRRGRSRSRESGRDGRSRGDHRRDRDDYDRKRDYHSNRGRSPSGHHHRETSRRDDGDR